VSKTKDGKEIDKPTELIGTEKKMITYRCPTRGIVTQEVEVKKYRGQKAPEHKQVDPEIAELLNSEMQELEEHGFHEEKLN
jgi:hypothetical protein